MRSAMTPEKCVDPLCVPRGWLPTRTTAGPSGPPVRLRCVTEPDAAQKVLLNRLGLTLPRRLRQSTPTDQV